MRDSFRDGGPALVPRRILAVLPKGLVRKMSLLLPMDFNMGLKVEMELTLIPQHHAAVWHGPLPWEKAGGTLILQQPLPHGVHPGGGPSRDSRACS